MLGKREVEVEWETFLLEVARERNFMKETMSLFRIDYQVIREHSQEKCLIGIELDLKDGKKGAEMIG